jgi:hypothetical protein
VSWQAHEPQEISLPLEQDLIRTAAAAADLIYRNQPQHLQPAAVAVLHVGQLCNAGSNNRCREGECDRLAINNRSS